MKKKINDIKKINPISWYKKINPIFLYQESIFDIKKWISLNQKMKFWFQEIGLISWYKKSIFLYQAI